MEPIPGSSTTNPGIGRQLATLVRVDTERGRTWYWMLAVCEHFRRRGLATHMVKITIGRARDCRAMLFISFLTLRPPKRFPSRRERSFRMLPEQHGSVLETMGARDGP